MRDRIPGTGYRLPAVLVTAVLVTVVLVTVVFALGASASGANGANGTPPSTAGAQPDDSGGKPGSAYGPGSTLDFEPSDGEEGTPGRAAIPTGGASTADPR